MKAQYSLTTWENLSQKDRDRIYNNLTYNSTLSAMRNLIEGSSTDWMTNEMAVVRINGRIMGWSILFNRNSVWVFVAPYYRRKGIGSCLVRMVLAKSRKKKIRVCCHDSRSSGFWMNLDDGLSSSFCPSMDRKKALGTK